MRRLLFALTLTKRPQNGYLSGGVAMNQTAHTVGKEHVDLARLDDGGNFANAKGGVHQCLTPAIGRRLIVRRSGFA
jgi:hypothetical protein